MSRMKTFFIYAVIIIIFYFFSNILIYLFVKGTYNNIEGEVLANNIEITDAKATYVNGYIDGRIINNTEELMNEKYIKMDIYSKRDVHLGTKYVKIVQLDSNESMSFHMGYKFTDSYRYKISIVDNVGTVAEEQLLSEELEWYFIIGTLIFVWAI